MVGRRELSVQRFASSQGLQNLPADDSATVVVSAYLSTFEPNVWQEIYEESKGCPLLPSRHPPKSRRVRLISCSSQLLHQSISFGGGLRFAN